MSQPAYIASRYRVRHQLGHGGMGAVYLVKHINTGEQLALKVLHAQAGARPNVLKRFKREMRTWARIKSEHAVRVIDADVAPELKGAPFLVMEFLRGCNLDQLLQHKGQLGAEEVVWTLAQAARGLDKAHKGGIVHRDVKPENLFLHRREDGRLIVKILDFGVARFIDSATLHGSEAKLTMDGTILGTPLYLSPEQARGSVAEIGRATDVWAIGMIAFELLTGHPYWASVADASKLLAQIAACALELPSALVRSLPPGFDAWFLRACASEPQQRWPSVGEQIAALASALEVAPDWLLSVEPPPGLAANGGVTPEQCNDDQAPVSSLYLELAHGSLPKSADVETGAQAREPPPGPEAPLTKPEMGVQSPNEVPLPAAAQAAASEAPALLRKRRRQVAITLLSLPLCILLLVLYPRLQTPGPPVTPGTPTATPPPNLPPPSPPPQLPRALTSTDGGSGRAVTTSDAHEMPGKASGKRRHHWHKSHVGGRAPTHSPDKRLAKHYDPRTP